MTDGERKRFPPQIKYIVGNEAAERFSYYGMAAILTLFLHQTLGYSEDKAEFVYHVFGMAVYFTPLLGAYISDRFWGKYPTIIRLSVVYVAGHAAMALWESEIGVITGLALIAIGAGGIKPCVSAHVGDQFTKKNKELLPKVFSVFYWSINVGSVLATASIPKIRAEYGARIAFAIPGILMAVALFVFWLGRRYYIYVPPTGKKPDSPGKVLLFALGNGFDTTRTRFGDRPVDEAQAVLRVGALLVPVIMFWALFFQTGSTWVTMATEMNLHGFLTADMLQAFNPALVLMLIPLFASVIYPAFERRGSPLTALRRMKIGMFVTAVSFVAVAVLRSWLDSGGQPSAFWMLVPYLILTTGEILVSITGLEFAYTQAPRSVKSTIMSIWMLTMSFGHLLAGTISGLSVFEGAAEFLFWAVAMAIVGVIFLIGCRYYRVVEYVEEDEASAEQA